LVTRIGIIVPAFRAANVTIVLLAAAIWTVIFPAPPIYKDLLGCVNTVESLGVIAKASVAGPSYDENHFTNLSDIDA